MRNTFGSNECRLLCINSSQDGLVDHEPNPWDHYVSAFLKMQSVYIISRLGVFFCLDMGI